MDGKEAGAEAEMPDSGLLKRSRQGAGAGAGWEEEAAEDIERTKDTFWRQSQPDKLLG